MNEGLLTNINVASR